MTNGIMKKVILLALYEGVRNEEKTFGMLFARNVPRVLSYRDAMKILNLYAGIGGNRKLWPSEHDVTAVEINPKIAEIYRQRFPNDIVLIEDAHEYLLNHFKEFDFIWSSPPCQSHSVCNWFLHSQEVIRYPDMKLYEEIIFLSAFAKCPWIVENVKGYYPPLIKPMQVGRHYFWANFIINQVKYNSFVGTFNRNSALMKQNNTLKRQTERNEVNPKIGLHVFNCAFKIKQKSLITS